MPEVVGGQARDSMPPSDPATRARKNFELDLRRNPNLTPEDIKELAKGHFNP
jgi:hypothetical protein